MSFELNPRHAKRDDISAIQSVLASNRADVSLFQQSIREIQRNINNFFVVEHGKKVVGCAGLHTYKNRIAEIRGISVRPEYQRQGVGDALLNRCIDISISKGIRTLWLSSTKPNYFSRFGFQPISKWSLPMSVLMCKIRLVFQQPADRWMPALLGRHTFMKYSAINRSGNGMLPIR